MDLDKCSEFFDRRFLRFRHSFLFKNISFDRKTVLDIGGGNGLLSFYAAYMGAKEAICIEPEDAGSSSGVTEEFEKLQSSLQMLNRVKLEATTIQDFDSGSRRFDIILLYASINHLDEEACINLQHDGHAVQIYREIFQKLSDIANNGAKLIIVDCSRYNFFALCNLKNPFTPNVEWHKHQSPKYWAKLLSDVGFCNPRIQWIPFRPLSWLYSIGIFHTFALSCKRLVHEVLRDQRRPDPVSIDTPKVNTSGSDIEQFRQKERNHIGRIVMHFRILLFGNRISSYFLQSTFCLTMEKK